MTNFFQVNQDGIAKEIFDNEAVIINIPLGKYYSVRGGTGVRILELLEDAVSIEYIVSIIVNEFNIDEVEARESIATFLSQLESEQIIQQTQERGKSSVSEGDLHNKLPFEKLELEVFDDMQELILLDPVHDVESFKGWPQKKGEDS